MTSNKKKIALTLENHKDFIGQPVFILSSEDKETYWQAGKLVSVDESHSMREDVIAVHTTEPHYLGEGFMGGDINNGNPPVAVEIEDVQLSPARDDAPDYLTIPAHLTPDTQDARTEIEEDPITEENYRARLAQFAHMTGHVLIDNGDDQSEEFYVEHLVYVQYMAAYCEKHAPDCSELADTIVRLSMERVREERPTDARRKEMSAELAKITMSTVQDEMVALMLDDDNLEDTLDVVVEHFTSQVTDEDLAEAVEGAKEIMKDPEAMKAIMQAFIKAG